LGKNNKKFASDMQEDLIRQVILLDGTEKDHPLM
jgi:hypothetical protein